MGWSLCSIRQDPDVSLFGDRPMAQPSCKKRVINPIWEGKTAPGLGSPRCTYQKWWLSMENGWIPWGAMVVIQIVHSLPSTPTAHTCAKRLFRRSRISVPILGFPTDRRWPLLGFSRTKTRFQHAFTSGWWFQPLWKILVNGKDYPIYYGKNMFQTTNQTCCFICSTLILKSRNINSTGFKF